MTTENGAVTIKIFAKDEDLGNPGISALTIIQGSNVISSAELVIDDGDAATGEFKVSNDPNFAPGSELTIEMGHGTKTEPVFTGLVVRQQIRAGRSGRSSLFLELKHPAVKMTHARNVGYFLEKDDAAIIEELINRHGISPDVDAEMNLEHERMVQYNVSDWDFLVMRAEANGRLVYTTAEGISVLPPIVKEEEDSPTATFGVDIWEVEAETESRDQFSEGTAISWDHAEQEIVEQSAEAPADIEESGKPDSSEMAESLGEGTFQLRHAGDLPDSELINWSSATLMRSRLSKIQGRVKMEGSTKYQVGGTIVLAGLSDVFNGPGFIGGIQHDVKGGTWTSQVQVGIGFKNYLQERPNVVESPVSGLIPPIRGLQIGVVKEIESDPGGLFRVLVKMPTINDAEDGYWCRVMHPDAGAGHSIFFQPQVGDEVVIGFLSQDPRQAIVLGSLHNNADNEPPISDNDAFTKRGIVTPESLSMIFDDEDKSILFQTPSGKMILIDDNEDLIILADDHGNIVELTPDGINIESGGDLNLKASGDVNVEGMNISMSANAQFKAEGSAGMEVSSPATTIVKGAVVQIN